MIGEKLRREWQQASATDRYHAAMFVVLFVIPAIALISTVVVLAVNIASALL